MALVLTLGLILPVAVSVMAADVAVTKGVTPWAPNIYCLGDTIHYVMSIINPSSTDDLVIEAVWDVLPDGSTVYPTGPALPYTLHPGQSQGYTYDWVANETGTVINKFCASGYQISPGGNDHFEVQVQKSSLVIDPSIDVEKYVKNNAATWQDADSAPGPSIPFQTWVVFRFTIYNTGDAPLTGVNLSDTDISSFYIDEACTNPASFPTNLAVDETKTYYSRLAWAQGQHDDEATANGTPPVGAPVSDNDPAYYFGVGDTNTSPTQPSNISPANGATSISLTPSLQSSVFSDPDSGDIHAASLWQIRTSSGTYSNPVFNSGADAIHLTSVAIPSGTLNGDTTYYWRVTYEDNHGAWSSYSSETSFTTIAPPQPTTTYVLSISSNGGGSVTSPGEGAFTYDAGTVVDMVATPDAGYRFVKWSWCVGGIANVNTGSTTITMDGNYWIAANFEAIPG